MNQDECSLRQAPGRPEISEHLREDVDRRVVLGFMGEFADDVDDIPGTVVWVYGSLVKPCRFHEWSDVDVALESLPAGMTLEYLQSLLSAVKPVRSGRRGSPAAAYPTANIASPRSRGGPPPSQVVQPSRDPDKDIPCSSPPSWHRGTALAASTSRTRISNCGPA